MNVNIQTDVRQVLLPRLNADWRAIGNASAKAVEETTTRIKERVRARVRMAFPSSSRLPTVIRGDFFRATGAKPATGYVYSAWFKRGFDILQGFAKGLTIRPREGNLLLVPFSGPGAVTQARYALFGLGQDPRFKIIRTLGGKLFLAEVGLPGTNQKRSKLVARLVPQIRLPKRIDVEDIPAATEDLLRARLIENLKQAGI